MKSRRLLFFLCVFFLLNANAFSQSTDLVPFQDANGKWGYKNKDGIIAIASQFEYVLPFDKGTAIVKTKETTSGLDANKGFGVISVRGDFRVKPEYDTIIQIGDYFIASKNTLFYNSRIFDKQGKEVLKSERGGTVDVHGIDKIFRLDFGRSVDSKYYYGYYDEDYCSNNEVLGYYVRYGYQKVYGFIRANGEVICEPQFEMIDYRGFWDGLCLVIKNGKYGFVNKDGKTVIRPKFLYANRFSNGIAAVHETPFLSKNVKTGFIDTQGNIVIKPQFDEEFYFGLNHYGIVWVKKGDKWGMMGKSGKTVADFQYVKLDFADEDKGFVNAVTKDGTTHYFDSRGTKYETSKERDDANKLIIECLWDKSTVVESLLVFNVEIKSSSKVEYCDVYLNGKRIKEPKDGSSIAEGPMKNDSYNIIFNRTLALREGINTIRIEAKNAGGITNKTEQIEYNSVKNSPVITEKPVVALGILPDITTSSKLVVTAEVTSESEIASCDLYLERNCDGTKGSHIAPDIIEGQEKGKLSKTMSRTFTLCEGENNIVAEATNAAGMTKVVKKVIYEKPEPPAIAWDGIVPENTTKETLEVKATIASKTDVTWRIMKSSSGKTKGSDVAADIIENVVASGKGSSVNGQVTLSSGYNTITIEATNAYERETVSKKVWHSPCEKRIALVIGNKDYKGVKNGGFAPLEKTLNDADTIAKLLKNECGFDVIKVENANHRVMEDTINEFINRVKYNGYKTAFVYYSGHGASYDRQEGDNYLIPIDCADCTDSIKARGIEVRTRILQRLEKEIGGSCPVKIAMLDCCRTYRVTHCSPLPGANGGTRGSDDLVGLSEMKLPEGVAVLYGAEFDHPSYDGIGANSPFVECFVKYVREHPKSNWRDLGFEVRKMVNEMTKDYVNPYTQKPDPQKPYPDIFKFSNADKFYLNPYHDKP